FDVVAGREDAALLASPTTGPGSFLVTHSLSLWGGECGPAIPLGATEHCHLVLLTGFRYLELNEELNTFEHFTADTAVPAFGGSSVQDHDRFSTRNQIYTGQIGGEFEYRCGNLTVDVRGKCAFGTNHERMQIDGASAITSPTGATTVLPGGRFADLTNSVPFKRDVFCVVPEVDVNISYQVCKTLRLYAGYTFIFCSDVVRPGDQIDTGLNVSQIQTVSGPGTLFGPARPTLVPHGTDFWAQGLNFGMEFKY